MELPEHQSWYLGLDFGDTGISAVLLHRPTENLYPLYWEVGGSSHQSTRLQPLAYVPAIATQSDVAGSPEVLLQNFKFCLQLGIPHYSPQTFRDEPILQWSDLEQVSLSAVQQVLPRLLSTLTGTQVLPVGWESPFVDDSWPAQSHISVRSGAIGLTTMELRSALGQLAGVVVNTPANWSDTYRFNVRESILAAGLVSAPEVIFMVEDAIATVLSGLKTSVALRERLGEAALTPTMATGWRGQTLVISSGASTTDLALVNIPADAAGLTAKDFVLRSLPYAGNAIDQDILCQLIYSQISGHRTSGRRSSVSRSPLLASESNPNTLNSASLQWGRSDRQATPDPEAREPHTGLQDLELPLPGEPDLVSRCRLQQRLNSSAWGRQLLDAARYLKMILQHQERFTLELEADRIVVLRRQMESLVFVPFIQRLNRELNTLLAQTGVNPLTIEQVICTGGTASLPAIARWLRQKLPNATIIQDTYPAHSTLTLTCSRVAYGLATLPLYPQVLNLPQHQYSDYFVLLELLRACPDRPLLVGEIVALLEQRGINTEACQFALLSLLEGELPAGLVPPEGGLGWFSPASQQNPDYPALTAEPLFYKEGYQTYRPNLPQLHRLTLYLNRVLASAYQKLEEPLSAALLLSSLSSNARFRTKDS